MQTRVYDFSLEWFNVQTGWKSAHQDDTKKNGMFELYNTPKEERKAWANSA